MGSIKLILGDCLQEMKKIPDKSIDLIVTDPPYNLGYTGRGKQNFSVFANDNQTSEEFNMWFEKVITEIYRLIKDCGAFYCWCDYRIYPHIFHIINKFFIIKNCIIWRKNNFGMGQHYRFQHEFCVYAIKGEHKLILDKRNQSDVWEFKKDDVSSYRHPTQKPVFAMYKPIEFSSQRGGVILDPFMGSGTTGVACVELGRNFIGIEIEPKYFEIAQRRINQTMENLL